MAYNFVRNQTVQCGGLTNTFQKTTTASQLLSLSESVADDATLSAALTIDVSAIKGLMMSCDQNVTVDSDNESQGAISLIADHPYVWQTGDLNACLLTHDVATLTVANASGETANFELRVITDATP
jgi:hypothetical protein